MAFYDCMGMKPHKNKNSKYCLYEKNNNSDACQDKDLNIAKNS